MTVISELGPLIAVFVAAIAGGVEAQFTPPQSSGCTGSAVNLSPCLSYVTGNSSFLAPNRACCSGLDTVVKNSATCLCQFISGSGNPLGIPINRTTALSLPGACNITAPSLSQCKAAGNPADAPGASPASSPAQATAGPAEAPPLAPSTTENPKGKVFPSARSPLSSGNISPAHSDDGNIPSASAKRSSGGAVAITPSMMMLGAVVGVISASMSIKW